MPKCCRSNASLCRRNGTSLPGRKVDSVVLDNCFDGWDGRAAITWPKRRLQLALEASQPFRHLVIYVPPGRDFFCVEPVSHANGLVGLRPLGPGATLAGEIVFHVSQSVRGHACVCFLSKPEGPQRFHLRRRLGHRRLDRRAFRGAGRQGRLRRHRRAGLQGAGRQDRRALHQMRYPRREGLPGSDRRGRRQARRRSPRWSTMPRATTGTSSRT